MLNINQEVTRAADGITISDLEAGETFALKAHPHQPDMLLVSIAANGIGEFQMALTKKAALALIDIAPLLAARLR
jgi:hypothetical protein